MKRNSLIPLTLITLLFLGKEVCWGQNLIPNASFEEYVSCPTTLFDLEFTEWDAFRATPDYYNNCSSLVGFNNPYGSQVAHSGVAYAAFITYITGQPTWREHLGVKLISPLQIGQTYYVSFYVSKGFKQPAHHLYSNNVGALFSTVLYDDTLNPSPDLNFAHVYEDSIITETTNWIYLHWSFVADSAYQYFIVGNFFDDAHTDTLMTNQFSHDACYYIDDVCVSVNEECTATQAESIITPSAFSLSPNPFTTSTTITLINYTPLNLQLFDALGREAPLQYQLAQQSNSTQLTIERGALRAGVYFLSITTEEKREVVRLVVF